jgi:hypothetical protein
MNKHQCPHCGEMGISALRKCFLGPSVSVKCESCGKPVSVPYWSIVIIIPMLTGMFATPYLVSDDRFVAYAAVIATVITWVLWDSIVPLEKR